MCVLLLCCVYCDIWRDSYLLHWCWWNCLHTVPESNSNNFAVWSLKWTELNDHTQRCDGKAFRHFKHSQDEWYKLGWLREQAALVRFRKLQKSFRHSPPMSTTDRVCVCVWVCLCVCVSWGLFEAHWCLYIIWWQFHQLIETVAVKAQCTATSEKPCKYTKHKQMKIAASPIWQRMHSIQHCKMRKHN